MKCYLTLHRLAFRKTAANAVVLRTADLVREFDQDIRQLRQDREEHAKAPMHYRAGRDEAGYTRRATAIEASLERAIAVRDIAVEEKQRADQVYEAAARNFRNVLTYLEEHRELIPEGIPSGL